MSGSWTWRGLTWTRRSHGGLSSLGWAPFHPCEARCELLRKEILAAHAQIRDGRWDAFGESARWSFGAEAERFGASLVGRLYLRHPIASSKQQCVEDLASVCLDSPGQEHLHSLGRPVGTRATWVAIKAQTCRGRRKVNHLSFGPFELERRHLSFDS